MRHPKHAANGRPNHPKRFPLYCLPLPFGDKNIMSGYNNLRSLLHSATPEQWAAGLQWYVLARQQCATLAAETHHSLEWAVDVVALTSPQKSWADNIPLARKILTGERGEITGRQASQISFARTFGFDAAVKRGYKIRAFRRNLLGDESTPCVDTHIIKAWYGDPTLARDSRQVKRIFDSKNYYTEVATDIEILASEHAISPAQCQAVIWVVWRSLHTHAMWESPRHYKGLTS